MRLLSILVFMLLAQFVVGQSELFKAIGNADAEGISQSFGNDVEICIGSDQDFYSRAGAVKKLETFFGKVKPLDASYKHKGSNKDKTSEYLVGSLNSTLGKYRIFIYFEGDKVTGIHFNKE